MKKIEKKIENAADYIAKNPKRTLAIILIVVALILVLRTMISYGKRKVSEAKAKTILKGQTPVNTITKNLILHLDWYWRERQDVDRNYKKFLALNDTDFYLVMIRYEAVTGKSLIDTFKGLYRWYLSLPFQEQEINIIARMETVKATMQNNIVFNLTQKPIAPVEAVTQTETNIENGEGEDVQNKFINQPQTKTLDGQTVFQWG